MLKNSYEDQIFPEVIVLHNFKSQGFEDENISNENENGNFVNKDDIFEVSVYIVVNLKWYSITVGNFYFRRI